MAKVDMQDLLASETPDSDLVISETLPDALVQSEETQELHEEVAENIEAMGEMAGTAAGIEAIIESLRKDGMPKDDGRFMRQMHMNINTQLSRLGMEHQFVAVGLESYETISQEEVIASLEGIVGRIWDGIANMSSKIFKATEDFFKDFYEDIYDLAGQAEGMKRELAKRDVKPTKESIEISQAHKLHIAGRTDLEAIIKGYENLVKVNRESFTHYLSNVHTFYKNYFKAYQEIVGTADWYEKAVTGGEVIKHFIQSINNDLNKVLGAGDDRTEMSGGKLFDARNIVLQRLPELKNKNPQMKVDSYAEIKTPSIKELNHLLDLIIEDATIIKSWWGRWGELTDELRRARAVAAEDSKNIDQNRFFKLISRWSSQNDLSNYQWNILGPLNDLAWHTLSVTRSLLKMCNKAMDAYPRKL